MTLRFLYPSCHKLNYVSINGNLIMCVHLILIIVYIMFYISLQTLVVLNIGNDDTAELISNDTDMSQIFNKDINMQDLEEAVFLERKFYMITLLFIFCVFVLVYIR